MIFPEWICNTCLFSQLFPNRRWSLSLNIIKEFLNKDLLLCVFPKLISYEDPPFKNDTGYNDNDFPIWLDILCKFHRKASIFNFCLLLFHRESSLNIVPKVMSHFPDFYTLQCHTYWWAASAGYSRFARFTGFSHVSLISGGSWWTGWTLKCQRKTGMKCVTSQMENTC